MCDAVLGVEEGRGGFLPRRGWRIRGLGGGLLVRFGGRCCVED